VPYNATASRDALNFLERPNEPWRFMRISLRD
jgi:hypothetical protein